MRNELSVHDGLVLRWRRIVIPGSMRSEMLERIHDGHQGLNKCKMRANTSLWWPGRSSQISHKVENSMYCREHRRAQNREPLLPTPLPDRPWRKMGIEKENFLVTADCYSRYLEILHMSTTTSAQVTVKLKATFGCQ